MQWEVNDTASATALADAIICSPGGVSASNGVGVWTSDARSRLRAGSSSGWTGPGPEEMQAASGTMRLFTVISDSLEVRNMKMSGGNQTFGGAISTAGSYLSLYNASFVRNDALVEGGALYASLGSVVSFGEEVLFDGNHASGRGGAISCARGSRATLHGGQSQFVGNIAGWGEGALYLYRSSDAFWSAKASFAHNTAGDDGGALLVYDSNATWGSEASFVHTTTGDDGGALSIWRSRVSWAGDASFVNNTAADHGGALLVYDSNETWGIEASFVDKAAGDDGGTLSIWNSRVSWESDASFISNTAVDHGGALLIYHSSLFWSSEVSFAGNCR